MDTPENRFGTEVGIFTMQIPRFRLNIINLEI